MLTLSDLAPPAAAAEKRQRTEPGRSGRNRSKGLARQQLGELARDGTACGGLVDLRLLAVLSVTVAEGFSRTLDEVGPSSVPNAPESRGKSGRLDRPEALDHRECERTAEGTTFSVRRIPLVTWA
jgi:hypothetical protein